MGTTTLVVFSAFKSDCSRDLADSIAEFSKFASRYGCTVISAIPSGNISRKLLGYEQTVIVTWNGSGYLKAKYDVTVNRSLFGTTCNFI